MKVVLPSASQHASPSFDEPRSFFSVSDQAEVRLQGSEVLAAQVEVHGFAGPATQVAEVTGKIRLSETSR